MVCVDWSRQGAAFECVLAKSSCLQQSMIGIQIWLQSVIPYRLLWHGCATQHLCEHPLTVILRNIWKYTSGHNF